MESGELLVMRAYPTNSGTAGPGTLENSTFANPPISQGTLTDGMSRVITDFARRASDLVAAAFPRTARREFMESLRCSCQAGQTVGDRADTQTV